jgi:hypothetical protein
MFKKIKLFFTYTSILRSISRELEVEYNARIDSIYRIYTVLNIPQEYFEDPYNIRTSDINVLSRNFISDFRNNFSQFLVSKGLLELFELYEIRKVDKYSYLLIFGFSLFNTRKFVNNLIMWFLSLIVVVPLGILIYYLIKTLF